MKNYCAECGREFTTPPIILLDKENAVVCSRECEVAFDELHQETKYEDPNQLWLEIHEQGSR